MRTFSLSRPFSSASTTFTVGAQLVTLYTLDAAPLLLLPLLPLLVVFVLVLVLVLALVFVFAF